MPRLLAYVDAQLEESFSHSLQTAEQGQGQLELDVGLTGRLTCGRLLHGGSFLLSDIDIAPSTTDEARKEPSLYVRIAACYGTSPPISWGLPETSADLLGFGYAPLHKDGYYVGGELFYPLSGQFTIGTVVTREELSRDDSLVQLMAQQGRFGVRLGKWERASVYRFYLDVSDLVRVGVYRNNLSNPYPWLSGIVPVDGEGAFGRLRGSNKWGVTLAFQLR